MKEVLKIFRIAQTNAFEAKGRQNTAVKVIQRLFNVDLYTVSDTSLLIVEANVKCNVRLL